MILPKKIEVTTTEGTFASFNYGSQETIDYSLVHEKPKKLSVSVRSNVFDPIQFDVTIGSDMNWQALQDLVSFVGMDQSEEWEDLRRFLFLFEEELKSRGLSGSEPPFA